MLIFIFVSLASINSINWCNSLTNKVLFRWQQQSKEDVNRLFLIFPSSIKHRSCGLKIMNRTEYYLIRGSGIAMISNHEHLSKVDIIVPHRWFNKQTYLSRQCSSHSSFSWLRQARIDWTTNIAGCFIKKLSCTYFIFVLTIDLIINYVFYIKFMFFGFQISVNISLLCWLIYTINSAILLTFYYFLFA